MCLGRRACGARRVRNKSLHGTVAVAHDLRVARNANGRAGLRSGQERSQDEAVARSARNRTGQARGGPDRRSGEAIEVCRDGESISVGSDGDQGRQDANAFALPGGKMAVYTGIFPMAKTEAGLAAVMGHEVVHALARHGAERMSQGQLTNAGTAGRLGRRPGRQAEAVMLAQAAMAALGVGAQVGVLLPFSRKHESEADYIGILLAADAGYDPRESVALWERMGQMSGGRSPVRVHVYASKPRDPHRPTERVDAGGHGHLPESQATGACGEFLPIPSSNVEAFVVSP